MCDDGDTSAVEQGGKSGFRDLVGTLGHGTFVTWQVASKREERRGQRKATQQRSWLVLSLVYDEASELSRREDRRLFLSRRAE